MDHLGRKITRGKWSFESTVAGVVVGRRVLECLKVDANQNLSFWKCFANEVDVEEIVLAIATARRASKPDTVRIVVAHENELTDFDRIDSPDTADIQVKDLKHRHVEMIEMTEERLMSLAQILAPKVESDEQPHLFKIQRKRIRQIILKAIGDGRVGVNDLPERVRQDIPSLPN